MQPTHNTLCQNVRGPTFIAVPLFEKVAETVEGYADEIAERAAALGALAEGTVQVAAKRTLLVPYPLRIAEEKAHLFAVASSLAAYGQSAREAFGKPAGFGEADTPTFSPRLPEALIANCGSSWLTSRPSETTLWRRKLGT